MAAVQDDAERFLSALAPDGELTFQTFDDAKLGRKGLSRVLHGNYWRNAATLGALNNKGAGCFVMVNRGNGKGRKTAAVQQVRALFLDLDGSPLAPVEAAPIRPPIMCETSPGKFHAYWPIAGMPLADFKRAQQALAGMYGGDPKVCDLPRVMRLPGYLHTKDQPFRSRLLHCDPVKPWDWPDFAETMGLHCAETNTDAGQYVEGMRNVSLYRFACGLRQKGIDRSEALRRVKSANARCCSPPLDAAEVEGIVASAWNGELQGFVKLPYSLIDGPAFQNLTDAGKLALIGLIRQHNGSNNGRISFTRAEARQWGLDKRRRKNALQDAEASGLIEFTEHGILGGAGHRASPDLFRLTFLPDRGQIDPYASDG
jgi:hypothetical protein